MQQARSLCLQSVLPGQKVYGKEQSDQPLDQALSREGGHLQNMRRVVLERGRYGVQQLFTGGKRVLHIQDTLEGFDAGKHGAKRFQVGIQIIGEE